MEDAERDLEPALLNTMSPLQRSRVVEDAESLMQATYTPPPGQLQRSRVVEDAESRTSGFA